jgi:glycyl-tRNA synthetase beta chain
LLSDAAEVALYESLRRAEESTRPLLEQRAYTAALTKLAELRPSVDKFFDEVLVMSDDVAIRQNRLALLAELRASFLNIADVSRLTAGPE